MKKYFWRQITLFFCKNNFNQRNQVFPEIEYFVFKLYVSILLNDDFFLFFVFFCICSIIILQFHVFLSFFLRFFHCKKISFIYFLRHYNLTVLITEYRIQFKKNNLNDYTSFYSYLGSVSNSIFQYRFFINFWIHLY